jgi:hypothetical protein
VAEVARVGGLAPAGYSTLARDCAGILCRSRRRSRGGGGGRRASGSLRVGEGRARIGLARIEAIRLTGTRMLDTGLRSAGVGTAGLRATGPRATKVRTARVGSTGLRATGLRHAGRRPGRATGIRGAWRRRWLGGEPIRSWLLLSGTESRGRERSRRRLPEIGSGLARRVLTRLGRRLGVLAVRKLPARVACHMLLVPLGCAIGLRRLAMRMRRAVWRRWPIRIAPLGERRPTLRPALGACALRSLRLTLGACYRISP